jgi:hypothetical protein
MKFYLLIGILLIYFPVLIYFKNRIIGETAGVDKPEHLRWYEGASYIISHTTDAGKRSKLVKLREQSECRNYGYCSFLASSSFLSLIGYSIIEIKITFSYLHQKQTRWS